MHENTIQILYLSISMGPRTSESPSFLSDVHQIIPLILNVPLVSTIVDTSYATFVYHFRCSPMEKSIVLRTQFPPIMRLRRGIWPIFHLPLRWISQLFMVLKNISSLGKSFVLKRLPLINSFSKNFETFFSGHT
jgi:hypothetical protein